MCVFVCVQGPGTDRAVLFACCTQARVGLQVYGCMCNYVEKRESVCVCVLYSGAGWPAFVCKYVKKSLCMCV